MSLEHGEIRRDALYQVRPVGDKIITQTGEEFDARSYSKFKYGSGEVAARYGYGLADLVGERYDALLNHGAELVITSSAFKHVPTASYAVAVNMHAAINHQLAEMGREASGNVKIHRHTLIEGDYGTMSQEEREARMRQNKLHIGREEVEGRHLLVVDDVKITGAHERKIEEAVKDLDYLSLMFLYVVQMDAEAAIQDPTIENRMNHALVHDLNSLADVIATKNFLLNARTCKYILKWNNEDELRSFFETQSNDFLHTLYTGSIGDGYGFMSSYQNSLHMLKEVLENRGLLIKGRLQPPPLDPGMSQLSRLMDREQIEHVVTKYNAETPEIQEVFDDPYEQSIAAEQLRQADEPEVVLVNPSYYNKAAKEGDLDVAKNIRAAVENHGNVFGIISDKPVEMLISETTRLNSPEFRRPVPHYGTEDDTRKRIYIDPAMATPEGLLDAPVIIGANGTEVYLLQRNGIDHYYLEDKEYREQMAADSEHWRNAVLQVLRMLDPKCDYGKLSIVEDSDNYKRGKSRYAPPDFRVMYHISAPVEDPEMDMEEMLRDKKKLGLKKKEQIVEKLAVLRSLYPRYQELYRLVKIDEVDDPDDELEPELDKITRAFEYAGIAPEYRSSLTAEDLDNIRILHEGEPTTGHLTLHFVPKNAGEDNAVAWVVNKLQFAVPEVSSDELTVTTIADQMSDLSATLSPEIQTRKRIIMPQKGRMTEPFQTASAVKTGEVKNGQKTHLSFVGGDIFSLAQHTAGDTETGVYTYADERDADNAVTILVGDPVRLLEQK